MPHLVSSLPGTPDPAMTEATRLVQAGRLADATALIQRTLTGQLPTAAGAPTLTLERRLPEGGTGRLKKLLRELPNVREHLTPPHVRAVGPTPRAEVPTALPGTVRTGVHHSPAGGRPYRLYVPSTGATSPRPLLVMLHGGTQDGATFADSTGMDAIAEEHGLLVVYPEQVTSANPMRYWNWFSDQQRTRGEPAIIAGVISEMVATEDADPSRVYVAGFSAGAAMAAVLASTHPDVVAAVGIHSGLAAGSAHDVASAFTAMRSPGPARRLAQPVPAITFHGDADPTVSIANSGRLADQFGPGTRPETQRGTVAGARGYTVSRHHNDNDTMLEQWVVHGMAHSWSGGAAGRSYTDPAGPNASAEMVRFFLDHHH